MQVPFWHRKPIFIAWLKTSVSYLVKVLDDLYNYWEDTIIDAMMSPQIITLEHYLNNRFQRNPADIFISDGEYIGPWFFTDNLPGDPEFYWDQPDSWLWTAQDEVNTDFVVNIPAMLLDQTSLIAACVQKYKLAGKTFYIQLF